MECYFWCSSGAGVQLYFTLLWRCTKRQLWVERLAHLPRTAPQQNLGRKIRKEKHERVRNGEREKRQIPSHSGSATVKDNFLSSSSCTNATEPTADVNSTSLTLSSQVLSVSRDLEPLAANLGTLCLGCEHLSFSYRSKGQCWDSLLSPGQQGEYLWVLRCRVTRATREARSACDVNFLTFDESLQKLGSLFLGYLFTACIHFPLYMLWDPLFVFLFFLK